MSGDVVPRIARPTDTPQPLGRGAVAATGASVLFVVAGYVINVVLGRALGPVDYGLFGVVIGLMTVVNALQTSAVPQAIAKFAAEQRYQTNDLLVTGGLLQMGSGVVLGVILFSLADPVASLLKDEALADPLRLAAFAFPSYAMFTLLFGIEGGLGRYVRQAFMMSVYSSAKATLAVVLGLLYSTFGAVAGYVIAPLIGAVTGGSLPLMRRGRLLDVRPILAYATPLLLLAVISMAYMNLDLFLVKSLVPDPSDAGYYTAAQNIARVPYFLSTGLATILLPAVARVTTRDPTSARLIVTDAIRFGILLVLPVAAVLLAGGREAVDVLYGHTYEAAATPLGLLSAAMGVFAMFTFLASLLAGVGRPSRAVTAAAGGLLTSAGVGVSLVPTMAMQGAAVAALAGALVALLISLVAMFRTLRFDIPWLTLLRAAIASIAVAVMALFLNGVPAILLGTPMMAIAYVGLLVVTGEIGPAERQRLRALLPPRFATGERRNTPN